MKPASLWLSDVKDLPALGSSLDNDMSVDVAIVGGGFVGLWTAIHIKDMDPNATVAVFEQGRCGQGASSLNGGFLMSWWPKAQRLISLCGRENGRWLLDQSTKNISEMQEFLAAEQEDAELLLGGWLWTSTAAAHDQAWCDMANQSRALDRPHVHKILSAQEIKTRTGSEVHRSGVLEPVNGTVHPGKLAYSLARIARKRGVLLFENAEVTKVEHGVAPRLTTPNHKVDAGHIVIASNIWSSSIPELSRHTVCVTSAIVATPPIPERLAAIGWTGGESISDSQAMLDYYRTTRDGRIVFGKGIAHISYKNVLSDNVFMDSKGIATTEADFRARYPMLRDVPIEYGWSGPIDRSFDGLPVIGHVPNSKNTSFAVGWSGNGVGPSRLGGRMLAGLALQRSDRWTENGFVNRATVRFPPEPIRYVAGSIIRNSVLKKDVSEMSGKPVNPYHKFIASFAPAGTEDKA